MPLRSTRAYPRNGCYAGFMEYVDYHVDRLVDSIKKLNLLDTRSSTTSSATTAHPQRDTARYLQRDDQFQRRVRTETPEFLMAGWTSWAGGILQPLRCGLGTRHEQPYQWTKRWPRISGALAPERLCTGPRGSRERRIRSQFAHIIDIAPTISTGRPARAIFVNGVPAAPDRGRQYGLLVNDAKEPSDMRHSTSRCSETAHLSQGMTAVTRHKTPWLLIGEKPRHLTRTMGTLRHSQRLEPGETTSEADAEKLHELHASG